ncbi:MAG: respiratory nitrate reductase subunit gamma [Gracilibacteraceae bacterium]|jgi:nitrate reductase gamma subunit|nr:respiratory nitrate reductase subunit gamma [Gracilibacteraceae bacterium]
MLIGICAYAAVGLFFALTVRKFLYFAKMPLHGRMELYPVPGEPGRSHGGSYMENPEWWRRERRTDKAAEFSEMLKEILLIKRLRENSRAIWWASYPFHLGLYLLAAWTVLLVFAALTGLTGGIVFALTALTGYGGFACGLLGALLLLVRRIADEHYRVYTTPQEFLNLGLLIALLLTGLCAWGGGFAKAQDFMGGVLRLQAAAPDLMTGVHLALLFALFIYIPLSKMSHYVGKYYSFHHFLWDNAPNLKGTKVAEEIARGSK